MGNWTSTSSKMSGGLKSVNRPHTHIKCRGSTYPREAKVHRFPSSDDQVSWSTSFPQYSPVDFTANSVASQPVWADQDIRKPGINQPKWNTIDGNIDRTSHIGHYEVVNNLPRNPVGRTGITGRGCLGRWGPNHAADPIVTRWKRDRNGAVLRHSTSRLPILQFIAIQRRDSGEWAIPGGMVDPGERVSITLKREFLEEALNVNEASGTEKHHIDISIEHFFDGGEEGMVAAGETVSETLKREFSEETMNTLEVSPEEERRILQQVEALFHAGDEVYRGYVDDPRNTDNSWMETVAVNFHDETGSSVGRFNLNAGDDAMGVRWADMDGSLRLFASHIEFIQQVAKRHNSHW